MVAVLAFEIFCCSAQIAHMQTADRPKKGKTHDTHHSDCQRCDCPNDPDHFGGHRYRRLSSLTCVRTETKRPALPGGSFLFGGILAADDAEARPGQIECQKQMRCGNDRQ